MPRGSVSGRSLKPNMTTLEGGRRRKKEEEGDEEGDEAGDEE